MYLCGHEIIIKSGGVGMDMKKYMTFKVTHKKLVDINEDTQMKEYGAEESIMCFVYGKNLFIREDTGGTMVSAKTYLTLNEVAVGDIIDGQVVKSVGTNPESWNSDNVLYEVLTWNS